jgi:hypothetical protein
MYFHTLILINFYPFKYSSIFYCKCAHYQSLYFVVNNFSLFVFVSNSAIQVIDILYPNFINFSIFSDRTPIEQYYYRCIFINYSFSNFTFVELLNPTFIAFLMWHVIPFLLSSIQYYNSLFCLFLNREGTVLLFNRINSLSIEF